MTRKQKKTLIRIIVSVVLTGVAWAVDEIFGFEGWKALLLYIAPYLVIGYDVLWDAIRNIAHGQVFDEHFLMAIATVGAFGVGDYREASAVMIFYQVGELFQSIAVGKSRKSISALMDIRPDYAVVVRDGKEETVSPEEVELGETIVIKPGEKIPLDGEIIDGSTSVNTAALTGESLPADKTVGRIRAVIVNDELEIRECLVQYGLYCLLQCLSVPLVVNSHDHRDLFFKLCPHTLLSLSFLRHADLLIDTAHYFICCLYAESFCCPSPMLSHFPA